MTRLVTLKITDAEEDILSWYMHRVGAESVSAAFRRALVAAAQSLGLAPGEVHRVRDDRQMHRPRRSAHLCRLVGPRRRGTVPRHD